MGDIRGAPNMGLRGRSRSARRNLGLREEIENFIRENAVDDRAADALRDCPKRVQEFVLDRGNLSTARNPSAALLARIRDAREATAEVGMGGGARYGRVDPFLEKVERFLQQYGVSPDAADIFRACDRNVQAEVMERGLAKARNPSGALISRIKDVKAGVPSGGWAGDKAPVIEEGVPPWRDSLQAEVDAFVQVHDIDEDAANSLRRADPRIQEQVIELGVAGARNPSAAVKARIRELQGVEAQLAAQIPGGSALGVGSGSIADDVEDFLMSNEVDVRTADILRSCAPDVQQLVIERGGLTSARNPSSVLLARIRDATSQADQIREVPSSGSAYVKMRGLPFTAIKEDIMEFFRGFDIIPDGIVFGVTREGRPSGEAYVPFLTENSAKEAILTKNRAQIGDRYIELFRSTVVEAERSNEEAMGGAPPGIESPLPEDFDVDGLGGCGEPADMRFAPPPMPVRPQRLDDEQEMPPMDDEQVQQLMGEELPPMDDEQVQQIMEEVEEFLRKSDVDERAASTLRECPPHIQAAVIDRGDLSGARNPSSLLLARVRETLSASGSQPEDVDGRLRQQSLEQRIEDFIRMNGLDDRAADALRTCTVGMAEMVLEQGDLSTARNPSAALLARVRDARAAAPPSDRHAGLAPFHRPPNIRDKVDKFLAHNEVSPEIANDFREAERYVQEFVLERGISNARNPSGALIARMREARDAGAREGQLPPPPPFMGPPVGGGRMVPPPAWRRETMMERESMMEDHFEEDVETFLRENDIDSDASNVFRRADREVQEAIMSRGLAGARNPSSALRSRVRDLSGGIPLGGDPPVGGRAPFPGDRDARSGKSIMDEVKRFVRTNGIDERAAETLLTQPPFVQEFVLDRGDLSTARNPSAAMLARIKDAMTAGPAEQPRGRSPPRFAGGAPPGGATLPERVDRFIRAHDLGHEVVNALLNCEPEVQEIVTDRDITNARNPSAACMARIRDAKASVVGGAPRRPEPVAPWRAGSNQREQVVRFIRANGIDEHAANALLRADTYVQEVVMEKGVKNANNPSSAVVARIRELQGAVPPAPQFAGFGPPMGGDLLREVDDFIEMNAVDVRAADALRGALPGVQEAVLDRGDLRSARNPSALLLSRIREFSAIASQPPAMPRGPPMDMGPPPMVGGGDGSMAVEVEDFLMKNPVDIRAADALRNLSPRAQALVIDRGNLTTARNPSAALLSRVRDAQGMMEPGEFGESMYDRVERFLETAEVDIRAANAFRSADPKIQEIILERGLVGARNPSSLLLSMIRDAKNGVLQLAGKGKGGGPPRDRAAPY